MANANRRSAFIVRESGRSSIPQRQFNSPATEYWMPAFAGMTASSILDAELVVEAAEHRRQHFGQVFGD